MTVAEIKVASLIIFFLAVLPIKFAQSPEVNPSVLILNNYLLKALYHKGL